MTNSGEGSAATWDWKSWDQGAGGVVRWVVVVDIFAGVGRWVRRVRRRRAGWGRGAMVVRFIW